MRRLLRIVSPLGTCDGDKLRTGQVIQVANPSLEAGKRLKGCSVCVERRRVTLTAAVQGNCRSRRWVSPLNLGLDLPRSHKLSSKRASTVVLVKLLSVHVLKILEHYVPIFSAAVVRGSSSASAEFLEDGAKRALQGFASRVGETRATADRVYSFLFGKLDGQYMHHLAATWFMGESLLSWLNPLYVPRFVTNRVYARIALRRTLVTEAGRRAVMLGESSRD